MQALQAIDRTIKMEKTEREDHVIAFGKGKATVEGIIQVDTPVGRIKFYVVPADTPFLFCLQNIDKLRVRLDNL